jgi:hypothetical protein
MRILAIAVALGMFVFTPTYASTATCPLSKERAAGDAIDFLGNWQRIYEVYKKYRTCDDGYIAEGFSDGVSTLLAKHWDATPRLLAFTHTDRDFEQFVLRHVDATVAEDQPRLILDNARHQCPNGALVFCKALEQKAAEAIEELK